MNTFIRNMPANNAELHCDLHGPCTPSEAARLVLGEWTPERTGYLCPACALSVRELAEELANRIDQQIAEQVFQEVYGAE